MYTHEFSYRLPPELIAQTALARGESRLLCVNRVNGALVDTQVNSWPELLGEGDLVVFNDTQVIPARLYGTKVSGGQVEIMLERVLDLHLCLAQIRASKAPKPGSKILLNEDGFSLWVRERRGAMYCLESPSLPIVELLNLYGHVPLPPYINRPDTQEDRARYQTVFAAVPGAVAAPTAGLHFNQELLQALDSRGVERAFITLHVGSGTFAPLRGAATDAIETQSLHKEYFSVSPKALQQIQQALSEKRRIIAVGTTVARTLETLGLQDFQALTGETDLFIYPGFKFRVVNALFTNFHLPESSLLMLVCAFGGKDLVLKAYNHAVDARYRFYSYGDAMFLAD